MEASDREAVEASDEPHAIASNRFLPTTRPTRVCKRAVGRREFKRDISRYEMPRCHNAESPVLAVTCRTLIMQAALRTGYM